MRTWQSALLNPKHNARPVFVKNWPARGRSSPASLQARVRRSRWSVTGILLALCVVSSSHSAASSVLLDFRSILGPIVEARSDDLPLRASATVRGMAIDDQGSIYLTGQTGMPGDNGSIDAPPHTVIGEFSDSTYGPYNDDLCFVIKLDRTARLQYVTYVGQGGNQAQDCTDIAIDSAGNAYVVGQASTREFPVTDSFGTVYRGATDVIVFKLNAEGNRLVWSGFLGGSFEDTASGIALDPNENVYITGTTESDDFPVTAGAYDDSFPRIDPVTDSLVFDRSDAFVAKITRDGSRLAYATFLGGWGGESGLDIAVDATGHVYVTGQTGSTSLARLSVNFPTTANAFKAIPDEFEESAGFVTKLSPDGASLVWSTFLGGGVGDGSRGGDDAGLAIAVDAQESVFVGGWTRSERFPTTPGAWDASQTFHSRSERVGFLVKLNRDGSGLEYGTYLGGSPELPYGGEYVDDIAIDASGAVFAVGGWASDNFPLARPIDYDAIDPNDLDIEGTVDDPIGDLRGSFLTKLDPTGSNLMYSTFTPIGIGIYHDGPLRVAIDAEGAAYVAGRYVTDYGGAITKITDPGPVRDTVWRVTEIYIATLGYAPDDEGLQYWVNNIDTQADWTPTTVAQSFFDQPLVQEQYPADQSSAILIEALYQNIFGRPADAEGLAYWEGELSSGRIQRNQMITALIEGGWANPDATADMARFGNLVEVGLAFAAYQAEHGIQYSQLTDTDRSALRQAGREVLASVTEDEATRDAAIGSIQALLDSFVN